MAIEWWRSYHGAPLDAKWIIVARRARTKPGQVAAVWYALQDYASQSNPRGTVAAHDSEALAAFYGWPTEVIDRIKVALRERGLINADGVLSSWAKRQVKREDVSTERVRKHRKRVTQRNANETQCNARVDKSRVEKKTSSIEEVQKGERPSTIGKPIADYTAVYQFPKQGTDG